MENKKMYTMMQLSLIHILSARQPLEEDKTGYPPSSRRPPAPLQSPHAAPPPRTYVPFRTFPSISALSFHMSSFPKFQMSYLFHSRQELSAIDEKQRCHTNRLYHLPQERRVHGRYHLTTQDQTVYRQPSLIQTERHWSSII